MNGQSLDCTTPSVKAKVNQTVPKIKAAPDDAPIEKCIKCLEVEATSHWIFGQCLPVPAFGDITSLNVKVASVGLNPSSTEFFAAGQLKPLHARLSALTDFGVTSRGLLKTEHVAMATRRRADYFRDGGRHTHEWFTRLSAIMDACGWNWKYENGSAVHVDIVACVTKESWTYLKDVALALTQNCRGHLFHTLSILPAKALLLFDGKSACNAVAGVKEHEWKELCGFTDSEGRRKRVWVRFGSVEIDSEARRFCAWNIPAKYLSEEAVARVGEWLRCRLPTEE